MKSALLVLVITLALGPLTALPAAVIHVPGDQPTIQAGIYAAVNGDTVLVADGIWTGPGNYNLNFGGRSITVSSESVPENCIIDCQGQSRGFHFHSGEDENAVVHGFTIRNGYVQEDGAGILVEDGASPVISNCILTGNSVPGYPWSGGGAALWGGLIHDCIIRDNRADNGGGLYLTNGAMAFNCLIVNNWADELGGGICTGWASTAGVSHCTIAGNYAGEFGGGIFTSGMVITNSITYDNDAHLEGADGYIWGYDSPYPFSYSYTDLGGEWIVEDFTILDPGDGVIFTDPIFATGPLGPWYLSQVAAGQSVDSPCVDTGDPGGPLFGTTRTDLQPDTGVPDMGYHTELGQGMYICHEPFSFTYYLDIGDPPPDDRLLNVWRCVEGTLDWTVESTADWLTLHPLSGSSTGEVDEVTVSVDISSLAAGTELAEIVIRAPGAQNDPVTIPVTLRLDGPYAPQRFVVGPGPSPVNPPRVRVFTAGDPPILLHQFLAYGATGYGVRVACGDPDGNGADEIITGAGPGAIYGPHVRGFEANGLPVPGLNFIAYGTLKYGVNVACGDLDGDRFDEIITGAGPGAVFGPHVRAFHYDHHSETVSSLGGVNFFAYGTLKYGVNVACGDLDGDGVDEIVTGAGPGAVFGPHVRGWNVDGGTAAPMPGISFMAYDSEHYGVNVACGDLDGDGLDEIVTAPGPGPSLGAFFRGWNIDGSQVTPVPGCELFAWPPDQYLHGARVSLDRASRSTYVAQDYIIVGGGPDPEAGTEVKKFRYEADAQQLVLIRSFEAFDAGLTWGVDAAGGGMEQHHSK